MGRCEAKLLAELVILFRGLHGGTGDRRCVEFQILVVVVLVISRHRGEGLAPLAVIHGQRRLESRQRRALSGSVGFEIAEMLGV